eukprot:GHVO01003854.1.p1 GENE.GHVO01003854.1~~GHVO01003854.1.p1  ORF type:complete len:526 (-),score=91.68 GHVO01003854.1:1081-2613(-)
MDQSVDETQTQLQSGLVASGTSGDVTHQMDQGGNSSAMAGGMGVAVATGANQSRSPSTGAVVIGADGTPQVEIKLFVGRVPRNIDEDQLRPTFEEFGQVLEVAIIRDKSTQNHKGSAFIRMASLTQADNAIRALNNVKVLDQSLGPLQVRYANGEAEKLGLSNENANAGTDQAKLFVGSLPKPVTEDDVCNIFKQFGTIDEVFVMKDNATGQGKGCAFVKFAFKEQAIHAIKQLNGLYTVPGGPRAIEVRFAETKKAQPGVPGGFMPGMMDMPVDQGMMGGRMQAPPSNLHPRQVGAWKEYFSPEGRQYYHNEMTNLTQWDKPTEFDTPQFPQPRQDPTGPPGANIFIFHVPNNWGEHELLQAFGCHGNIISARIATDRVTGRNKGYAFVSYDNVNASVNAVHHMNGFVADGKRLKVSIKQHEEKYAQTLLNALAASTPGGQGPTGGAAPMHQAPGGAVPGIPPTHVMPPMMGHMGAVPPQYGNFAGAYGSVPAAYGTAPAAQNSAATGL